MNTAWTYWVLHGRRFKDVRGSGLSGRSFGGKKSQTNKQKTVLESVCPCSATPVAPCWAQMINEFTARIRAVLDVCSGETAWGVNVLQGGQGGSWWSYTLPLQLFVDSPHPPWTSYCAIQYWHTGCCQNLDGRAASQQQVEVQFIFPEDSQKV